MSILTNNYEKSPNEDDDKNGKSKLDLKSNQEQTFITPTLRSILRKHGEKKVSTNTCSNVQQTSILLNENENNEERDSDYTGDEEEQEEEEESNVSHINIEKESKNNEQHYRYSSRQKQQNTTSNIKTNPLLCIENNQSRHRSTCVTFANDQPTIIRQGSSLPPIGGLNIEPRSSVTYINMKENLPKTTTTASPTMNSDYRPVYVSPLKYRPLLGLSANDSRLLLEKRVSLLGKPLVFHPIQKRSQTYRRTQLCIYNFLERAHGYKALIYHTFVFFTVFLCLFLSVVVTMPEYEKIATTVLLPSEILVFIWLSIELSLRIWSSGCRSRYQTLMGRLRFIKKPFCALDCIIILATFFTLCLNIRNGNGVFAASALRGLRFFQILRMLRMDRRGGTWKLLGSVVYAHRQELITTIYIGFLVLIFSSFVMFLVEKDVVIGTNQTIVTNITDLMNLSSISGLIDTDRHKFETFADALWWGIITLCTVGYGDKVPSSYIGKLIAAICSFIGISFFALPAGILGSGFALKVQQQQRQKHYKRRKIPAVLLIQNLWRVYAADEKSLSKATWKVHVRPSRKNTDASLSSHTNHHTLSFKLRSNPSFLNKVSFRRGASPRETPTEIPNNMTTKSNTSSTINAMRSCIDTLSDTASITPPASILLPHDGSASDNEDDHLYYANDVHLLTTTHRHAIRFIRKVKYFVARRKFREALRPYDVTDVIEQYSTGNVDMLARMKYLQARLDKVLGTSKSLDSYESGPSLASRICKIEIQVDALDIKVDRLCHLASDLLERNNRQSASNSSPPVATNRTRRVNPFRVSSRRQYFPSRSVRRSSVRSFPARNSIPRNSTQTTTGPAVLPMDNSRESLISLYCLFQDNLNSSKTDLV